MPPVSYNPVLSTRQARFGSTAIKAPALIKGLGDFTALGKTAIRHNQLLYATVILSRIFYSRSENEKGENARRDILGWYFWFMGSPLMQTGLLLATYTGAKRLLLTKTHDDVGFGKKLLLMLFNPSKLWLIANNKQLQQRQGQVLTAMQQQGSNPALINQTQKLFQQTINQRALTSLIGLAFTFFALGIGINLVNIAMTKASLKKKSRQQNNAEGSSMNGAAPSSTAAAFKPQTTPMLGAWRNTTTSPTGLNGQAMVLPVSPGTRN